MVVEGVSNRRGVGSWVEPSSSSTSPRLRSERETRERRERAREKARLKASERGRFIALQNDREKDFSRAAFVCLPSVGCSPRHWGIGARVIPVFVLPRSFPQWRGAAAFGLAFAFQNASPIPRGLLRPLRGSASPRATRADARRILPRAEGQCERSPNESAELCVAPPLVRPSGRLRRGDTLGAGVAF